MEDYIYIYNYNLLNFSDLFSKKRNWELNLDFLMKDLDQTHWIF